MTIIKNVYNLKYINEIPPYVLGEPTPYVYLSFAVSSYVCATVMCIVIST